MRISAKGRYALAAAISMAEKYANGDYVSVVSISEKLGISKIYLEQVFSLLKRGNIVISAKGSQGGYQLARMPRQITAFSVLSAVEVSLFEPAEDTVPAKAPEIEIAMKTAAFDVLDGAVKTTLEDISLYDLLTTAEKHKASQQLMFFI